MPGGTRNGALSGIHPADLPAHVPTALVDDVIWDCVSQIGKRAGRHAALAATGRTCGRARKGSA